MPYQTESVPAYRALIESYDPRVGAFLRPSLITLRNHASISRRLADASFLLSCCWLPCSRLTAKSAIRHSPVRGAFENAFDLAHEVFGRGASRNHRRPLISGIRELRLLSPREICTGLRIVL